MAAAFPHACQANAAIGTDAIGTVAIGTDGIGTVAKDHQAQGVLSGSTGTALIGERNKNRPLPLVSLTPIQQLCHRAPREMGDGAGHFPPHFQPFYG